MSVSRRLILSVGILMLLSLGVLGYQLWTVIRMQRINDELSNVSFVTATRMLEIEQEGGNIAALSLKYLGLGDESRRKMDQALNDGIQAFDDRLRELQASLKPWEAPEEVARLSTAWIDYRTQIAQARRTPAGDGRDDLPPELESAIENLSRRANDAREAVLKSIGTQVQKNQSMGGRAESISLAAVVLFLVLGGTVTYLTLHAINKPLHELTRGTRSIAGGEFSHRLPVEGPSEFAELARDFNAMSERLGELDEMKKDFVSHVSHELKAPLAAIRQTLAVTLEQVPGQINDAQRRLLQLSRNSAERLSAMVANLLDVSRLEAGTMEYEMSAQDIAGIARQVADEFSLKADEKLIRLVVNSEAPSMAVFCDGDRMIQVISNLVDNALKFSPSNSTIRIDVSHNRSSSAPRVTVSVSDSGHGVPDDQKQNVFVKFHQIKGRGKRTAGQGVGLGLAICKTIVDAHRGRIWVEDNPGGGSVFRVEIPGAQVQEAAKCG